MDHLVRLAKALSDPARVRILAALRQSELCVCELADALELSQSTLSTHLQTLRQTGLVRTRRLAKWIYYRLEPSLAPLIETLLTHFQDALRADQRFKRDAERIAWRLQLREGGRCVIGFCCPETRLRGGEKR